MYCGLVKATHEEYRKVAGSVFSVPHVDESRRSLSNVRHIYEIPVRIYAKLSGTYRLYRPPKWGYKL